MLLSAPAYALPPIDLTVADTEYESLVDQTIWTNTDLFQATGTGLFDPYLRVQDKPAYEDTPDGVEEGLNTDGDRLLEQVGGGDPHTHAVQFGDLLIVEKDGQEYYLFSVDFAEPDGGGQEFLTLEELRLYTVDESAGGSLTTEAAVIAAAGSDENYDLDGTSDQTVWLDYSISNKGNGESDIDFYIPTSYFAGANATDYFYTYVKFGNVDTIEGESWESDGSFEELRVLTGENPPDGPEPGTVALFGIGLIGLAAYRRK